MRATSARGRVPERALWRETIDLAIRTAEATAFVVHGRKIAADGDEHQPPPAEPATPPDMTAPLRRAYEQIVGKPVKWTHS